MIKNHKLLITSLILLILACSLCSPLYCNPFFSSSPHQKPQTTEQTSDNKDSSTLQNTKEPVPVLTGPTNPELAEKQGTLREKIASFFKKWEKAQGPEKSKILWGIILTSFLYGIIHAAGPGHRKTVVFSLYIARKSPWYEPLITGTILSMLHGGSAIAVMLIFKGISGSISANTNSLTIYMEGFSYGLIIILALFMITKETIDFIKSKLNHNETDTIETKNTSTKKLIPFLLSGIYPCPGAILILVLSFTLDILWAGITAVISMSLGMAVLIISVGYLAWFGRKTLFTTLKNKKSQVANITFITEIAGYAILLIFSIYVSLPFFISIIK